MDRRMTAPLTIVSIAALLLLQQICFPENGWLLLGIASHVVSAVIALLIPPEPVVRWFLDHWAWPVAFLAVVAVVARVLLAYANQSMRRTTPKIDPRPWERSSFKKPSSWHRPM